MATPHVAGAAALLRQARPGIRAGELKALMTSTARHQDGATVDEQGSGRVDVAAALAVPVVASEGALGFGNVIKGGDRVVRTLTYRNVTTAPVRLALKTTGTFTVSPATVTLPAGGTAEVTVTLDPAGAPMGLLREELVASAPQGGACGHCSPGTWTSRAWSCGSRASPGTAVRRVAGSACSTWSGARTWAASCRTTPPCPAPRISTVPAPACWCGRAPTPCSATSSRCPRGRTARPRTRRR
ncbi:S8 family serine peptidase [Streptosporangium lutulentum]